MSALRRGKPRRERDVLRTLGDLQHIERRARAGLLTDAANVFCDRNHFPGAIEFDRRLDGAHGLRGLEDRGVDHCFLKQRLVDQRGGRFSGPGAEAGAETAGTARILDQGEAGARGRRNSDRRIGARGHRKADAGQPQQEAIDLFAGNEVLALSDDIPDIAEHEQITGHCAGQARDVTHLAGQEAGGELMSDVT